ncbi:SMI1/KNR4 family protein [Dactylosporangium siamense]|uniref:Knr4/Smi1-like domain-containing protein n=1 Tax=Dactylosporangium siamense TaxID=685454 RepID=A0A919PYX5_9ACTN|nr:SMI1/KNR4 family protein [Dactylosporangium siamense]GIG52972.1 hypothetical protein Dsi01nite_110130 [Dactylosporangium siamense]
MEQDSVIYHVAEDLSRGKPRGNTRLPGSGPARSRRIDDRNRRYSDPVDPAAFDALAEPFLRKAAEWAAREGFTTIDRYTCTPEVIARVEAQMGVTFPEQYKAFMTRYGGGMFGYLELFRPVDPDAPETDLDIRSENDLEFPDRDFIAVAPVGTGDYWGFPVTDGRCHEQIWFHFHDGYERKLVAADFLEFVAEHGLKSSSDRALELRNQ